MAFENSPFAKSLYEAGSPVGEKRTGAVGTDSRRIDALRTPRNKTDIKLRGTPDRSRQQGGPVTPIMPKQVSPSTQGTTSPAQRNQDENSEPTGEWTHPSLAEVRKRTLNKERVLYGVVVKIATLVGLSVFSQIATRIAENVYSATELIEAFPAVRFYSWLILSIVQTFLVLFILTDAYKLLKPSETFDDLPLTPAQRKLLGLPDSPKAATTSPTPPKYHKSSPQNRRSPRLSPLSRYPASSSAKKGSPLAVYSTTSPRTGASPRKSTPLDDTPSKVKVIASTQGAEILKTPQKSGASPAKVSATKDSADSPASFTPSGRFLYMTESRRASFHGD